MPTLRPMYKSDMAPVIRIIDHYDDDDAEAAQDDYENDVADQYVLEEDDKVIGVTGFKRVSATENTAWLSWTYLSPEHCGKGFGKQMLNDLLDTLREIEGRKIFVKVSNYVDPETGPIYEKARKLYESLGFEEELSNLEFYDEGEDQAILGLRLIPKPDEEQEIQEEKPVIRFNGLYEIAETDGAYTFSWVVQEKKTFFSKRSFSVEDLTVGLNSVKNEGGRKVFITFPSNLPLIHQPLQTAGFKYVGRLTDYYEDGVDEMHFVHNLNNIP